MNTHREPIHRNLPAMESLACEVMDMNEARDYLATAGPLAVYTVGGERHAGLLMSEKVERRLLSAAPTLACAVIDLIAQLDAERFAHANTAVKVKRVEALAETWEEAARLVEARGGDAETVRDLLQDIRDALNGDDQ